jgi:phage terminase large subunit GpA-like protein
VTTPGPGYCHFPIAYQQEYFARLTSEEVRTRFVRGHPVRYWFKPSGKRNEALDRPRLRARSAARARGPMGGAVARRANRTAASAVAYRRRSPHADFFIAADGADESF